MAVLTIELDKNTDQSFNALMCHYGIKSRAELISKGISLLKIAAFIDETNGELIARKGNHETKIIVR